jgi:hypothetical protein
MTTMITTGDGNDDDRRLAERRKRNLAFEGQDRRAAERRAARDRRASRR